MRQIGAFEAKSKLGQLLDWVEAGEEVVITRRGKIVAKLVPPGASTAPARKPLLGEFGRGARTTRLCSRVADISIALARM
jgi:prevent-host-death family protein